MNKERSWWILGLSISIMLFFITAVSFNILGLDVLPGRFYGSLIGVVLTAIITVLLLSKQTDTQEKKEKTMKVFEVKLNIYRTFLENLYEIMKDGKIEKEEALKLQFQTSYIFMHTKPEHIKEISEHLYSILNIYCAKKSEKECDDPIEELFKIVAIFRDELYEDEKGEESLNALFVKDKKTFKNAISYFIEIDDLWGNDNMERSDMIEPLKQNDSESLISCLKSSFNKDDKLLEEWKIDPEEKELILKKETCAIKLSKDDGGYFFEVNEGNYARELYKRMRSQYGGHFGSWTSWWCYLDKNFINDTNYIKNILLEIINLVNPYITIDTICKNIENDQIWKSYSEKWNIQIFYNTDYNAILLNRTLNEEDIYIEIMYDDEWVINIGGHGNINIKELPNQCNDNLINQKNYKEDNNEKWYEYKRDVQVNNIANDAFLLLSKLNNIKIPTESEN